MKYFIFLFFFVLQIGGFANRQMQLKEIIAFNKTHKSNHSLYSTNFSDSLIKNLGKKLIVFGDIFKDAYITKSHLCQFNSISIITKHNNYIDNKGYYVMRYFLKYKKHGGTFRIFKIGGPVITKEIKETFKNAKVGDKITIYNVMADGPIGIKKIDDQLILIVK